jgi:hypothetical protein
MKQFFEKVILTLALKKIIDFQFRFPYPRAVSGTDSNYLMHDPCRKGLKKLYVTIERDGGGLQYFFLSCTLYYPFLTFLKL